MHTIDKKSTKKAWAGAIVQPAQEFPPTQLKILSGQVPEGLHGTLYRNGPARLERGGIRVGHWFDGDGAILAVHFTDTGATAVYRYIQTEGYKEETAANRLLYGNYGMTAPGPVWNRWLRAVKNVANTSVLALPDKLLALWEADNPYILDLENLNTLGKDDLGKLKNNLPYSAHPKIDQKTGEIYNFGVSFGITTGLAGILNLYKSNSTGRIIQKTSFKLDVFSLVHDFVLAGQYLVFFIPPVRLNTLLVLSGLSSVNDALKWEPQLGTQILVFDRESLSLVSRGETEPWFQWHFANGYVDTTGSVIVDIAHYEDFQTNQYLKQVATGETHTAAKSTFWRSYLNPQTGKVTSLQQVLDRSCEFPIVPPQYVGQASPHTYLCLFRQGTDIYQERFNAIARFDHTTNTLTEANLGENRYPSEPIYAPDPNNSDQGWIITVVYDGNTDTSEVWVFDSNHLDEEPLCRLSLPSVIPHSFHGTWRAIR
jgi:carotenoid cleavage dioxygenase-like enzyme